MALASESNHSKHSVFFFKQVCTDEGDSDEEEGSYEDVDGDEDGGKDGGEQDGVAWLRSVRCSKPAGSAVSSLVIPVSHARRPSYLVAPDRA